LLQPDVHITCVARQIPLAIVAVEIAAISVCVGCGRSPTGPTPPPSTLTVTGDTSLPAVGAIGHFTVIATWPDENTKDVTRAAVWFSQQPSVVSVVSPGVLKAESLGRTTVSVRYPPLVKDLVVEVRPPGTFVLVGTISEPPNFPVDSARLEIVNGPSAGRSTQSRSDGRYEFFGLSGNLQIRVTKEGYNASEQLVTVAADQVLDFQIQPLVDPTDVSGAYRLTMTASSICRSSYYGQSPLSPEARTRTYDAVLTQDSARVRVELSGADFVPFPGDPQTYSGRAFSGQVSGRTITFNISGDPETGLFDLLERLTPTTYLSVGGKLVATIRPSTIEGDLDGLFTEYDAPKGMYDISAALKGNCDAKAHHFVFERTAAPLGRRRLPPPLP